MSCLAEPPTTPDEIREMGDVLGAHHRANPDGTARVGGDLNVGITSNLTLSATINPDFGQVEADPAVVNLSAFETFYPEQRPFFNEGLDIFRFRICQENFAHSCAMQWKTFPDFRK